MNTENEYGQSIETIQVFKKSLESIQQLLNQIGESMTALQTKLDDTQLVQNTALINGKLKHLKANVKDIAAAMSESSMHDLKEQASIIEQAVLSNEAISQTVKDFTDSTENLMDTIQTIIDVHDQLNEFLERNDLVLLLEDTNPNLQAITESIDEFSEQVAQGKDTMCQIKQDLDELTANFTKQEQLMAQLQSVGTRLTQSNETVAAVGQQQDTLADKLEQLLLVNAKILALGETIAKYSRQSEQTGQYMQTYAQALADTQKQTQETLDQAMHHLRTDLMADMRSALPGRTTEKKCERAITIIKYILSQANGPSAEQQAPTYEEQQKMLQDIQKIIDSCDI